MVAAHYNGPKNILQLIQQKVLLLESWILILMGIFLLWEMLTISETGILSPLLMTQVETRNGKSGTSEVVMVTTMHPESRLMMQAITCMSPEKFGLVRPTRI